MVCGHSIRFRSDTCGQICAAEPSEKMSIGRADPRRRSRAERIGITEIKIEKGAILSQDAGFIKFENMPLRLSGRAACQLQMY
jgi:hypothetical protein